MRSSLSMKNYNHSNIYLLRTAAENRMCSQISDSLMCCLPCPATDWLYPDSTSLAIRLLILCMAYEVAGFKQMDQAAGYINVVALSLCIFLLLTFVMLPVEITKRHYLNICLLVGNIFVSVCTPISFFINPRDKLG